MSSVAIRKAVESDTPLILELIQGLAEYEKLAHSVSATEGLLRETLFGPRPAAEVLLAYIDGQSAGFALFFQNFSTFLAKPGLYLEDLFVRQEFRGRGAGIALLRALAAIAVERDYGRVDWQVLDWNEPSIQFYRSLGAVPLEDWTSFRLTGKALTALGSHLIK